MEITGFKFFALSLIFTLTSCGPYQDVTVSQIQQTKITKLSQEVIEAEIRVKIKNPNKVGFSVFRSSFDVSLNDNPIGKAKLREKVRIKPNSEETYTFHIVTNMSELGKNGGIFGLLGLALSKNVTVSMKGNIKAGKIFYKKKFPVDTKQKVPLFTND